MKIAAALATLVAAPAAFAFEPIPGSITVGGHRAQLEKAPVGSTVFHRFASNSSELRETHKVVSDRSLQLVSRSVAND